MFITWLKNSAILFPLVYSRDPYKSVLTLFRAEEADEGVYQCHVSYRSRGWVTWVGHVGGSGMGYVSRYILLLTGRTVFIDL